MIPLMAGGIPLGEGIPKICAPLMGAGNAELEEEAGAVMSLPADMVEWRADQYAGIFAGDGTLYDADTACDLIAGTGAMLRDKLKDKPILFTIRTVSEGGRADVSLSEYEKLIRAAASSGFADMTDLELFTEGENFSGMAAELHKMNISVVGSSHDFSRTPSFEDMTARLERMRAEGADVCKIAVMPRSMEDVLTLLSASLAMKERHPDTPLIALSMGREGIVSRVAGEYFGSDITFASAGKASAPGQISVNDCRYIMNLFHSED